MKRLFQILQFVLVTGFWVVSDGQTVGQEVLFDGSTLEGWRAVPSESRHDWSVKDGVIDGQGSADRLAYLVWREASLTDFELSLQYRLIGQGNTGIEIRSQPDPSGKRPFQGYHADLGHAGIGDQVLGAWDFHFASRQEYPCPRATQLVINSDGTTQTAKIKAGFEVVDLRQDDWNDVRIVARGNTFKFYINGKLASEFTDNAERGRLNEGAIGLQLHDKGMHVQFKDIQLRRF